VKWFNPNAKPYVLLAPSLLFVLLFLGYGTVMALISSLENPQEGNGWSFENYQELLGHPAFLDSLGLSLRITILSTLLSLLIGIIITRVLFRHFIQNKWKVFVWIPMLLPHFVAGYLVILFLAQSGWFSSLFYQWGFISDRSQFPILVTDAAGIGMMLTYVWKEVPFVVLMLLPVYYQLDRNYEQVVRTHGGSGWDVFKHAEWPWLFPVVMETGIILFAFIIAAFEVPYLLGVTYPKMLPVLSYQWFFEGDWSNRPLAMVAMVLTTCMILILSLIAFRLSQKMRFRMMKGR
jgi:putative spermidine/putrescine transport system permease protein